MIKNHANIGKKSDVYSTMDNFTNSNSKIRFVEIKHLVNESYFYLSAKKWLQ